MNENFTNEFAELMKSITHAETAYELEAISRKVNETKYTYSLVQLRMFVYAINVMRDVLADNAFYELVELKGVLKDPQS